jgi:hypothetical protein
MPSHVARTLEKYFPGVAEKMKEAESLVLGPKRAVDPSKSELVLTPSATVLNDEPGKNVKLVILARYEPDVAIVNGVDSLEAGPMMVPTCSKTGRLAALDRLLTPKSNQLQMIIFPILNGGIRIIVSPSIEFLRIFPASRDRLNLRLTTIFSDNEDVRVEGSRGKTSIKV